MKKWTLLLLILVTGQISWATCTTIADNNPMPFPFNIGIFQKYEKNWIFTQKNELSLRINRSKPELYDYFMVNHMTEVRSRGRLVLVNNQLCDLKNMTPFCLYNNNDTLRIKFRVFNECMDSGISILSLTR